VTVRLLAIDSGSQSTKVSVVDGTGQVLATGRAPLREYALGPDGRAVHPDDDLWDGLVLATRRCLGAWGGDPADLLAAGLCGIRSCRAYVDAAGRPTEPVLSWMDDRVALPAEDLGTDVALVTSAGGYLTLRLTGEPRDTGAAYRGVWPIDEATARWSDDPAAYERTGLPRRLLPELVDPGDLLGRVTADASAATGLPAGLPVHATANDKAVEALGCGLLEPGTLLLSLGTYVAAMQVGGYTPEPPPGFWVNAACVPGRFLHESHGVRRGMWTVSWLRGLLGAAAPTTPPPEEVQAWLDEGGLAVPPGCGGLVTLPDWLATPEAPWRRGVLLGLDGSHGPHHLYRSLVEGLLLTMRQHVTGLEDATRTRADRVLVSGGGSRSPLMVRVAADVLGRPVEPVPVADAAGLGSAICAAVGQGVHAGFAEAVAAMVSAEEAIEPDAAAVGRYDALAEAYAGLRDLTDPALQRLAAVRER
jgi:xylulokinase